MNRVVVFLSLAAALALLVTNAPRQAEARPQYHKAFLEKYESVKQQAGELKCAVCHGGPKGRTSKIRSEYAQALEKSLKEEMGDPAAKNVKDPAKINAAFDDVAKLKTKDGTTFGDLLKSGKLPDPAPEK